MTDIRPLAELVQYRADKGLSREDLGNQLGVSAVTVWRWESGERRPARKLLPKVSEITGVSIPTLLGVE